MTPIVGVHGIGNYVPGQPATNVAAQRSADWGASLAAGLGIQPGELDLTVAYYAPILHSAEPIAQVAALDPDRALDSLDPDAQVLAQHWIEALNLPEVAVQGRATVPLRHAVSLVADRFSLNGRLVKLFVAVFFSEVARYMAAVDSPIRAEVRDHVATVIADRNARVVIAHSLGSVVAYETLHAYSELKVDLLVTLGSPLAMPGAIFHRLQPRPDGIGVCPTNVNRWVNISDYGDPIAILRPFDTYFSDVKDLADSIGLFDFHRAARYLSCTALASTIQPTL